MAKRRSEAEATGAETETATMPGDKVVTVTALIQHLKSTGTGASRLERLAEFARSDPDATPQQALVWMEQQGFQPGTLDKAGKAIYGDSYSYATPGMTHDDVTTALREEVKQLKETVRELEGRNSTLAREGTWLRERIAVFEAARQPQRVRNSERGPMAGAPEAQEEELQTV